MEKTKACPCCGMNVTIEAEKCTLCGEPLIVPEPQKTAKWLRWACFIAMPLEMIASAQIALNGENRYGRGGYLISQVIQWIPYVAVSLLLGVLWIAILFGLRSYCQRCKISPKLPFIALICVDIVAIPMQVVTELIPETNAFVSLFLLLLILLMSVYFILQILIGLQLRQVAQTRWVGILFVVAALTPFVARILELAIVGTSTEMMISDAIDCVVNVSLLYAIYRTFAR